MWKFQHLDGQREINELHVPVGRAVKLIMTSEDVIHDFFVPAFRVKADVVPGRYTHLWFQATKPGRYHLFCAEYCGTQHRHDRPGRRDGAERLSGLAGWRGAGRVAGLGRREAVRRTWRATPAIGPMRRAAGPCSKGCSARRVPLAERRDASSPTRPTFANRSCTPPRRSSRAIQPIMPAFQGQVSEEQLLQLIAYVKSLQTPAEAVRRPEPPSGDRDEPGRPALAATGEQSVAWPAVLLSRRTTI